MNPERLPHTGLLGLSLVLAAAAGLVRCGSSDGSSGAAGIAGSSAGTAGAASGAGGTHTGGAAGSNSGGAGGAVVGGAAGAAGSTGGALAGAAGTAVGGSAGGAGAHTGLAAKYPCDVGIDKDPAFLFGENFEEDSIATMLARYSDHNGEASSMALVSDIPSKSCGKASGKFTADSNASTSSVFRQIPGIDELFYRGYVKYQAGVHWHHAGFSIKGYNPPSPWPLGLAGLKPNGDDSFSLAVEPVWGVGSANPRLDFYAYWMKMHSWMDQPQGDQAYYGNSVVHKNAFTADDDTWLCVEVHLKLNADVSSSAGALLDVWKNDVLMQHFDEQAPLGCWIKDSFCPEGADGSECTNYPSLCQQPHVPLDLQWRSTTALQVTGIGLGNYITEGGQGSVGFDDVVVATTRIGCLQ